MWFSFQRTCANVTSIAALEQIPVPALAASGAMTPVLIMDSQQDSESWKTERPLPAQPRPVKGSMSSLKQVLRGAHAYVMLDK